MTIDRHKLRGAYARLKAMQQTVMGSHNCAGTLGRDLIAVTKEVSQIIGEPTSAYELPQYAFYGDGTRGEDEQLKSRCADLLSAPGNFDRVINQATQVLEDRIRKKSHAHAGPVGVTLVNQVIKSEPGASVLVISRDKNEQEGYAHILRGMFGAYRNPTHHHLLDHITREEALKVCAFIDGLLKVVDGATLNKSLP